MKALKVLDVDNFSIDEYYTMQTDDDVFSPSCQPEKYVHHYTTSDTALNNILPAMTLQLGPLSEVNDPLEFLKYMHNTHGTFSGPLTFADKFRDVADAIRNFEEDLCKNRLVLCTSLDRDDCVSTDGYVECRGFAKPTLWAHYAERHKGVCLILDKASLATSVEHLFQTGEYKVKHRKVQYFRGGVTRPTIDTAEMCEASDMMSYLNTYAESNENLVHFAKHADWEVEDEYRWIVQGTATKHFVDIRKSLKGIVVGHQFDDGKLTRMLNDYSRIAIKRLKWSNGQPYFDEEST